MESREYKEFKIFQRIITFAIIVVAFLACASFLLIGKNNGQTNINSLNVVNAESTTEVENILSSTWLNKVGLASSTARGSIKSIEFKQSTTVPDGYVETINVSSNSVDPIYASYFQSNGLYNICIWSPYTINFPSGSGDLFQFLSALTNITFENISTSNVTNMGSMFWQCKVLTALDLSNFDTSKVTDMGGMFLECYKLETIDLSSFNTSNVTDMASMFRDTAIKTLDLSNFDTSNVTNMACMFLRCSGLKTIDLSSFDTFNVTLMNSMFESCTSLTELDLSSFDLYRVNNFTSMLDGMTNLKKIVAPYVSSGRDVEILLNAEYYIVNRAAEGLVTSLEWTSTGGNNTFSKLLNDGTVEKTTLVKGGSVATLPSNWFDSISSYVGSSKSKIKNIIVTSENLNSADYGGCVQLTGINLYYKQFSENESTYYNIGICPTGSYFFIKAPNSSDRLFSGFENLESITFVDFDTSMVSSMIDMFQGCFSLKKIDLSCFNTSSVNDFSYMFFYCESLEELDLSSFNVSKATEFASMLDGMTNLKNVVAPYVLAQTDGTENQVSINLPRDNFYLKNNVEHGAIGAITNETLSTETSESVITLGWHVIYQDKGGEELSGELEDGYTTFYLYGNSEEMAKAVKTGSTFKGWFVEPDCSGVAIKNFWDIPFDDISNTITLYADWVATLHKVTWENYNGIVLETDIDVPYGTMPSYDGETPVMPSDLLYTYTFIGWSPEVRVVDGDIVYVARYEAIRETYTIRWVNYDGFVLEIDEGVNRGDLPEYNGNTPTKAADAQYTYQFNGWEPNITEASKDITYKAVFLEEVNTYTVTWLNYNNANLETDYGVPYGTVPTFDGVLPTKPSTAENTYVFSGWSPKVGAITGDTTYTALFESKVRTYTITWINSDNSLLEMDYNVEYGTMPTFDGATPTREADAQYTYTFLEWSPTLSTVKGDITYTAVYDYTINTYTITWVNYDGNILETDENVPYGTTPEFNGENPIREKDAQYSYTFSGWSPNVEKVSANVTYTATYNTTTNKYTVTWLNHDGTELASNEVEYGVIPTFDDALPTKASDAIYNYTFKGWTPKIVAVVGDAVYTAEFNAELKSYIITWLNYDNSLLKFEEVEPGTLPSYNGTPTREADAQYTYTFLEWTPTIVPATSNATYKASYSYTVNKYTVTWKNFDGQILQKDEGLEYGTEPIYNGEEPARLADMQYTYYFIGWTPEVKEVTGDVTYIATFNRVLNTYTITWLNYNNSLLQVDTKIPFGQVPTYNGEIPTREKDAQYTYTFSGWSPKISAVTGDTTYVAEYTQTLNTYTITWLNYDQNELEVDNNVPYGEIPTYNGAEPTKPSTAQYVYTFKGWTPALAVVTGDATYTAEYSQSLATYTITWVNADNGLLELDTYVEYGATPEFNGATPTMASTAEYTYTFIGWTPEISSVASDVTYTATYSSVKNTYTITWVDYNNKLIEIDYNVEYGTTPEFNGENPIREKDAQYTYTFSSWTPKISAVTGDATYVAEYNQTLNTYTITWLNYDQNELEVDDNVAYGEMPTYNGTEPTKPSTAQYVYTFKGWTPALAVVTGDATYTAEFSQSLATYTITWVNADNGLLELDTYVEYGATPSYNGATPTMASTAEYTYTFIGWTPKISSVASDVTYTATYSSVKNTYTITWLNYNNSLLQVDTKIPFGQVPTYNGEIPTREKDAQYTYTFSGWSPKISAVTGDAEYVAEYNQTLNTYTITWLNYDQTELEVDDNVAYGEMPTYNGAEPTKPSTAQYVYTFKGWTPALAVVTGDATYTAEYSQSLATYTITWVNADDRLLELDTYVEYGTTPEFNGETPTMASTAEYTYTFIGWTPKISSVASDVTYTATYSSVKNTYTITWVDYNNKLIEIDYNVEYGTTPEFNGENPIREKDAQYTYTFSGWSPKISAVTGDAEYVAEYNQTLNTYTITWLNYDQNELEVDDNVPYGEMPTYNGTEPTKLSTAQYVYTFKGWTPALTVVTGDATYTAEFSQSVATYTITWVNADDRLLELDTYVEYGATPSYNGVTPTMASTAEYTYTFIGWTPEISSVASDVTYTATYSSVKNTYTITWVDYNNKLLEIDHNVEYGTTPEFNGENPTREKDAQYTYYFKGWNPNILTVVQDTTYTANYDSIVNTYTIIWVNYDGSVLESDHNVPYGVMPTYDGAIPEREGYDQYIYTFKGWNPEVTAVAGDAIYTANFGDAVMSYTVLWVNYDNSILETDSNVLYGATPTYDGDIPIKPNNAEYSYTFSGWTPKISAVTGNTTYTACFNSTKNTYTIIWLNSNNIQLEVDKNVEYGTLPIYDGQEPTKEIDAQHSYTFKGWTPAVGLVTGDATYIAEYNAILNTYTITWVNDDETVIEIDQNVPYGEVPTFNGDVPKKAPHAQYTYTFNGWTPNITAVTGDAVYKAQYLSTEATYTVTWLDYNNKILEVDTNVEYGKTPRFDGDNPTRPSTAEYTYTFIGWSPKLEEVTQNAEYTAVYESKINTYTVIWLNYDNTQLQVDKNVKYGTLPTFSGENPTRAKDVQCTYTFSGWSKQLTKITEDTTYIAQYSYEINIYTIMANIDKNGTITPKGQINLEYGMSQTIQFAPNQGYQIKKIVVDGVTQEEKSITQYTFESISQNHTISVECEKQKLKITIEQIQNEKIFSREEYEVDYGGDLEIDLSGIVDHSLTRLLIDGQVFDCKETIKLENITKNIYIRAIYEKQADIKLFIIIAVAGAVILLLVGFLVVLWIKKRELLKKYSKANISNDKSQTTVDDIYDYLKKVQKFYIKDDANLTNNTDIKKSNTNNSLNNKNTQQKSINEVNKPLLKQPQIQKPPIKKPPLKKPTLKK